MPWLQHHALYVGCTATLVFSFAAIGFDKGITDSFHETARPIDHWLQLLTFLGDGRVLIPGCILLWLGLMIARRPSARLPLLALGSILASGVFTQILKSIIGRPRPYLTLDSRYAHAPLDILYGFTLNHDLASFPSGHATAVFSLGWFTYRHAERPWQRWLVLAVAIVVGLTRVALWKHYLADTVAGAAIGIFFSEAVVELSAR